MSDKPSIPRRTTDLEARLFDVDTTTLYHGTDQDHYRHLDLNPDIRSNTPHIHIPMDDLVTMVDGLNYGMHRFFSSFVRLAEEGKLSKYRPNSLFVKGVKWMLQKGGY